MMNVSAVYLNTSHKRLLHNLRKKKIDHKVVKWVVLFLANPQTIIKTNKHITFKLSINLCLPQELSLSSILYLFYNADLLEDCAAKGIEAQGFINDKTLIPTSKSNRSNT